MLRIPDRSRLGDGFFYLCAGVVIAAILFGGGTRNGFLSDAFLQLATIPLLLVSLLRLAELPSLGSARWGLVFCAAIVAVPLLQVVPLPPAVWSNLPNRQAEVEAFTLTGQSLPWMPISVSPQLTWLSALSLLVPVSVFLGTLLLDYEERARLSLVILAGGLLSVFLGLSQVAQGPSSPLRFFDFSNMTEAIGFFANRNHFAALLYSVTLFAIAWAIDAALAAGNGAPRKKYDTPNVVGLTASSTLLVALVAGQAMARSRAGLGLTIVALVGAIALAFADRRRTSGLTPIRILVGSVALAVIFATQFALYRIMERFASDPLEDSRIAFAQTTWEAAKKFMPFGSGVGTFVPVYAMFEKPGDMMANVFANRAHNDVLELWLESSVMGLTLLAVFAGWFTLRSIAIWRRSPSDARGIDRSLARAATLVVALIVAHSVADYPLRTGAMAAIFAFACALMFEPVTGRQEAPSRTRAARKKIPVERSPQHVFTQPAAWNAPGSAPARATPFADANVGVAPTPQPAVDIWQDVEWPEEWRKPATKAGRKSPDQK